MMPDRVLPYYEADRWAPHEDEHSCERHHPDKYHFPNGETERTISGEHALIWYPQDRDFG